MLQEERSKRSEKASSKRNHQKWGELYLDLSELKESNKQLQAIARKLQKTRLRKRVRKKRGKRRFKSTDALPLHLMWEEVRAAPDAHFI